MHTHCVIGSGPAGVACATALLAKGATVLMLDAGMELEPDRAAIVRELAQKKASEWPADKSARVHGKRGAELKDLPHKNVFGSDFPYRDTREKIPWRGDGSLLPSLALGGLSNVWGAAMLPFRESDIADWPLKRSDLDEHYRAVGQIMDFSARHDGLEEFFPLYSETSAALKPSGQAAVVLNNLERHREALRARGWNFGQSRVAIRAADSPRGMGCVYCGHCMTGCVYSCIYNSADTIRELQKNKNFSYEGNAIVTKLRESSGAVSIEGFHRQTGQALSFGTGRAYLASGVIPTAQILLRSQNAFDQPLMLRDSQYFLFPIILARRTRDVQSEALHTLSQVFLELNNPRISRRSVHLQIYTYSDLIAGAVRQSLGPLKIFTKQILERLVIVQGYLHSDDSASIEMKLKCEGQRDFLELEPRLNPETSGTVKRVLGEVLGRFRALRGIVVPPMLQVARPGRSFHCGASIPMRAQPGNLESDLLGRPFGWSRVHVVDASVFPAIPATTITFSVMANAHRIGSQTVDGG
jgi:choline dehydrogenase-like flavoprotein